MTQDTPDWLLPATRINPSANLTADYASGSTTIAVDDTSGFRLGDPVYLTAQSATGQQTWGPLYINGLTETEVTIEDTVSADLSTPGVVVAFPTVQIVIANLQPSIPVYMTPTAQGVQAFTAPAPMWWSTSAAFLPSTTPSISEASGTGNKLIVTYAHAAINQSGADAFSTDVELSGPTSGIKWRSKISVPATAGDVDRVDLTGAAFEFAENEEVTLKFGAAMTATVFGDLTMGGYLG